MNGKDIIKQTFQDMHCRYETIFNRYYPAHGSTGFTERNLSCNFIQSIEHQASEPGHILSWYEAPLPSKKEHIDALCFDFKNQLAFLVESKRFSLVNKKHNELKEDLTRIVKAENIDHLKKNLRGESIIQEHWAVILADVWLEVESKKEVYNSWENTCQVLANDLTDCVVDFIALKSPSVDQIPNWPKNYRLLLLAAKVAQ